MLDTLPSGRTNCLEISLYLSGELKATHKAGKLSGITQTIWHDLEYMALVGFPVKALGPIFPG
jgi:hypothetical protein